MSVHRASTGRFVVKFRENGKSKSVTVSRRNLAAFDLIVAALKNNKNVEYAAIVERAKKKGLTIYPVMFGRAKLMLGLVRKKRKMSPAARKRQSERMKAYWAARRKAAEKK